MLMKVYGMEGFDEYKSPKYTPAPVPEFQNDKDIFQVIREGDVFLHHPYMSFDPVVDFVTAGSKRSGCTCNQTDSCIELVDILRSLQRWHRRRKMANRFLFWWN